MGKLKDLFNLLYNNINNNAAPGLSDTEIASFLTKALNEIVKQHVLGPATTYQLGINQTSKRDVELDTLIETVAYEQDSQHRTPLHVNGAMYEIDYDDNEPLVILSEIADSTLSVIELSYAQFNKFMAGVYKYPKKSLCWKLRHDGVFEIISPNVTDDHGNLLPVNSIVLVYVRIPDPIQIGSGSSDDSCELPEVLHDEIVQRAVELAKAAYASQDTNIQLSMGLRSE